MMWFKIIFVLTISAAASRTRQNPNISPKCKQEVQGIQGKERAAAVSKCEKKGQYPQKAISHLQNGNKSAAVLTIEESFQKCAKFSPKCAKELAPVVIQQLEFSGAAVSMTCRKAVAKVQNDAKKMKEVQACEKKSNVVKHVLVALNQNDLNSAVDAAETGLENCMGLSEKCANQLAPVVVNQIVMRAMMEQQAGQKQQEIPETTVFANTAKTVLTDTTDKLSLIGEALDRRGQVANLEGDHMSFLQKKVKTTRLPERFVSRMLLQLAR